MSSRSGVTGTATRPLTPDEAALLTRLLESDFPGVEELRGQVELTSVTGTWSHGSASLDLRVSSGATPSGLVDGPVPGQAWAFTPTGDPLGTLLLWVSNGYLSAIEYGWVTDEPPTTLPLASAVRDVSSDQ